MSSVQTQLKAAATIALPLSYLVSNKCSAQVKHIFIWTLWTVFLSFPFMGNDMEPVSFATMMTSVLAFIFPLKLTQLVLWWKPTTNDKDDQNEISFRGFCAFAGSFLWYGLAISRTTEKGDWLYLLTRTAEYMLWIVVKLLILPVLAVELHRLAKHPETRSVTTYFLLLILNWVSVYAGSWLGDAQCVVVSLLSAGRFELLPFNNYPFLAVSIKEYWGKRYNRIIHTLLKETVYLPAQNVYGLSKRTASLATFAVSGLLHVYVVHFTFQTGYLRAFVWFIAQHYWIYLVEETNEWKELPRAVKRIVTHTFFFLSLTLYGGLFVEAMPEWLDKNRPENIPQVFVNISKRYLIVGE